MKAVIAGGSGTLGRRLADDLARRGHDVVVLTRARRADLPHRQVEWDGCTVGPWADELNGAVVVNLAGQLVDRRPTRRSVDELRRSRVEPTRALVEAAGRVRHRPVRWIQMSTLAIYGDAGPDLVAEGQDPAAGPPQMPGVARPWEEAAADAPTDALVILRTGIVLDRDAPVVERLRALTRWGLGGRMGPGDQWVSWIHIDDFLAAVRFLVDRPDVGGVVHVCAPEPVTNAAMMRSLRAAGHRPPAPPVPAGLIRVGAWLLGSDPALALTGRRCRPERLLDAGFTFAHPTFPEALATLDRANRSAAGVG